MLSRMDPMNITSVSWTSLGIPAPQGSKRHVGNGILVEQSDSLPAWREQLIYDISKAGEGIVFKDGIHVELVFKFPRPLGHFNSKGELKDDSYKKPAPRFKTTRPDLDKLIRAVLDAITLSGVITDDSLCYSIEAQKVYCDLDEPPGVNGTILELIFL